MLVMMTMTVCIQDEQNNLRLMTFQMLLTTGRDMADVLIKRLIDLYICDSAATDAISSRLRDVCPSLYSCGDELYSKVCQIPLCGHGSIQLRFIFKIVAKRLKEIQQSKQTVKKEQI